MSFIVHKAFWKCFIVQRAQKVWIWNNCS